MLRRNNLLQDQAADSEAEKLPYNQPSDLSATYEREEQVEWLGSGEHCTMTGQETEAKIMRACIMNK